MFIEIDKSPWKDLVANNLVYQKFNKIKINRLRAIWPKRYQRGILRKSHQNDDILRASNAKK